MFVVASGARLSVRGAGRRPAPRMGMGRSFSVISQNGEGVFAAVVRHCRSAAYGSSVGDAHRAAARRFGSCDPDTGDDEERSST